MAKKKSFIIYKDSLNILDDLGVTEQEKLINAGKLLFAIRDFHNEKVLKLDAITKISFSPFKNQFIRDNEAYHKVCERNRKNGSKSNGRPPIKKTKKEIPEVPKTEKPPKPKKTQSVKIEVPTYKEFEAYAKTKSNNINGWKLKLKYDSWVENDWKDGNHKPIKNWKTKILNTLQYLINDKYSSNKAGNRSANNGRTAGTYKRSEAVNKNQTGTG